ncbi:MAG: hypothetical protein LBS75_03945 [Synergistaceae bacterium]|jgi:hypothetical protein|nr:hypothetical protein [Synergistaceae bacterium]
MAEIKRYCGQCFKSMPPDWNQRFCPVCGGRVKYKLIKRKPRKQPQTTERREKTAEKPIRAARRMPGRGSRGIFTSAGKSILGPRFMCVHPLLFFVTNVFTLGCRSVLWVFDNMPSLNMMAKREEKMTKGPIYLWFTSYFFALSFLAVSGFELFTPGFGVSALRDSTALRMAVLFMSVSLLAGKYLQYWTREAVIDGLRSHEMERIAAKANTFAPSPMLIWFLGFPYIQFHVNRMIRKKMLSGCAWSEEKHSATALEKHSVSAVRRIARQQKQNPAQQGESPSDSRKR